MTNLEHVDMHSSRNQVVLGSSVLLGLMVPIYLKSHPGAIQTGRSFWSFVSRKTLLDAKAKPHTILACKSPIYKYKSLLSGDLHTCVLFITFGEAVEVRPLSQFCPVNC